jgi:threonine/homoserine/homoserine lactone efflux protein
LLGIESFPLFLVSCILLNITPGQDTIYIVSRSVAQGKQAGIWSVAGIMTGVLVHTLLAALGLSTLLATSALAFSIVKFVGAGYLMWLGIEMLRGGGANQRPQPGQIRPLAPWVLYRQGVLTNVLNPKVALFFLSFLPQFVAPHSGHTVVPFLILGLVFFTTGSLWCLCLVLGAAWATKRLRRRTGAGVLMGKLTGALFVTLGLKLAFSSKIDTLPIGLS